MRTSCTQNFTTVSGNRQGNSCCRLGLNRKLKQGKMLDNNKIFDTRKTTYIRLLRK